MQFWIVTGTSRGLGEAIAEQLLLRGDAVCGIARGRSARLSVYPNYDPVAADLADTEALDRITAECLAQVRDRENCGMIGLINNAASVGPLGPLDSCTPGEIDRAMRINLIAPAILASCFLRRTAGWRCRRKVIHLSSGCARYANPGMSIYSAAKSGLEMLTRCAGAEQDALGPDGVEFLAVDPGMMDTAMQQQARETSAERFGLADYFKDAHAAGRLSAPDAAARAMLNLIDRRFQSGSIWTEPTV